MATKTVDVQRKDLSPTDAEKITALMSKLDGFRLQYGQHQFNLDYLRAQYEAGVRQTQEEGDTLRTNIQEAQTAVQDFSQDLLGAYDIDTSGEGRWSLDTSEGVFIHHMEKEVRQAKRKPTKRKTTKAKRKTTKARPRRTAKKTRSK